MATKFSQFLQGLVPRNTDIEVGLRSGLNAQGVSSGIADSAGANIVTWLQGAGPNVNYIGIQNNVTGSAPIISALGANTNVNLSISAKGTGHVAFTGTGAIGVPVGTTAQQPTGFNGGFRYNSDTDFLEYWDTGASAWVDVINGAALADATFVTNTNETADLPNSQPLSALSTGIMKVTTGTGIITSLPIPLTADLGGSGVASPTAHGILIAEGASAFTPIVLSSGQILIGSTGIDPIAAAINSGTGILVANGAGSITVSNTGVTSITGTVNQITASASTGGITLSIPSVFVAPGSIAATTTVSGTTFNSSTLTASRVVVSDASKNLISLTTANSAALVTTSAGVPIMTSTMTDGQLIIGSTGATPVAASLIAGTGVTITPGAGAITISVTGGAAVTSVSGTLNRITSTGGTTPVIDISASYVGQASITTVGALASGSLAAGFTPVTVPIGGTGNTTFTAYSVICAGTTATGAFQNVSGVGTSGQVLTSNGAAALPTWQASGAGNGTALQDTITQASHGFSVQQLVYLSSGTYTLAEANSVVTAEVVGIVTSVTNINVFVLTTSGKCTGLSGLTAGTVYWLSDGTPGLLTATAPTTPGNVAKPLFVADSTTSGYFINYRGEVIPTGTSGIINSGTTNQLAYYAANGTTISGLSTGNNGVLVTSGAGVPSISTTLPSGLAATNLNLTTPVLGTPQSGTLTNATGLPYGGIASDAWTDITATVTVNGFSAFGSKVIRQVLMGKICIVQFYINGTSNATSFTITGFPNTSANVANYFQTAIMFAQDNGAGVIGLAQMVPNATTLTIYNGVAIGAWTNSGTKQLNGTYIYETT